MSVEAVIFDWAGTTVDYGCFAPLEVFLEVFKRKGIDITMEEARKPMGMLKIDHIRTITQMPRVEEAWKEKYGKLPNEDDVRNMYEDFEPSLLSVLSGYTTPNPGVPETVEKLRSKGIKIGSTTGYTQSMMDIVVPGAKKEGYSPDCYFTPDYLPAGRPAPWMIYRNCEELSVFPLSHVVKVGDTRADILEGVNASVWSIGVILGSSEMGLRREEAEKMPKVELEARMAIAEENFYSYGAHYVIKTMDELPDLIEKINAKLDSGEKVEVIKSES